MNDQTRKAIELLAEDFCSGMTREYRINTGHASELGFLAGAEALDKLYSEGVGEFDEALWHKYAREHWINPAAMVEAIKMQFDQMKGRFGAAQQDANDACEMNHILNAKIKDLEAQLVARDEEIQCLRSVLSEWDTDKGNYPLRTSNENLDYRRESK